MTEDMYKKERRVLMVMSVLLTGALLVPISVVMAQDLVRVGSEFQVNTYTTAPPSWWSVAADTTGRFVVAWAANGADGYSVGILQRFDSTGAKLGAEFQVNTYTTESRSQDSPSVAADGNGNFVVVWQSNGWLGNAFGIFGQRFDSTGARLGSEFKVSTYTTGTMQQSPSVAADGNGSFVVAWMSIGQIDNRDVFGQRFDAAGTRLGAEFQVNTYTTGYQGGLPKIAADSSGNFVVVWTSFAQDGSFFGIFGQRFDSTGARMGSEFQANTFTTGDQFGPAVAVDGSGNFVVVWDGYPGVVGQRFDSAGAKLGGEFQVLRQCCRPSLVAGSSGDLLVVGGLGVKSRQVVQH